MPSWSGTLAELQAAQATVGPQAFDQVRKKYIAMAYGTEARAIAMISERQEKGVSKYGTTVAENPLSLREWLQHAMEEALDQAIYLARAIEEIDRNADDGK